MQLASQIAGTPAYMSPEQIAGDVSQLDGRSDIFSLGVVLYELLVGERPFRGKSLALLLSDIRSRAPKSPDRWHGDVPPALGAICMKCLAKRPADRFQTGKQLADSLQRWLTLEEKPRRALVRHQNPQQPVTEAPSVREFLGFVCIVFAFLAGLVACFGIWGSIMAPQSDGRLFFFNVAWRLGLVAGTLGWVGTYARGLRTRANRSGRRPA